MRAIARTRSESRSLDPFAKGKLANMHAELGEAYAGVGLQPEALREYHKALELCPDFVDLRTRLAALHRDMGQHDDALRELDVVKTTNPRFVAGRVALGITLYSAGREKDAMREWEAALEIDSDNRAARAYLDMMRAGAAPDEPADRTMEDDDVSDILSGVE